MLMACKGAQASIGLLHSPPGAVDTVVLTRYTTGMDAATRGLLQTTRGQLLTSQVVADATEARFEAEVLLAFALRVDRAALYSGLNPSPAAAEVTLFRSLVARRLTGEPVAYITGTREFYGLSFLVGPGVLIPRPETELLVERGLAAVSRTSSPAIADVGCGSGCVGIALAAHLPNATVWAIDLSEAAVAIAGTNAERFGLADRVSTLQGDLLAPLPIPVDLLVANLPYVNARDLSNLPASILRFEPLMALDGGVSGLDQIRRLVDQAAPHLRPAGSFLLEVGYDQAEEVAALMRLRFPGGLVQSWRDLGGFVRVIGVQSAAPEYSVTDAVCSEPRGLLHFSWRDGKL
jgi:release factor glutamine methyltransferase